MPGNSFSRIELHYMEGYATFLLDGEIMDWVQVLTVFTIIATNLITVITLYIHMDNKTSAFLKGIQDEMKDFHERLIKIEERTRREFFTK